MAVGTRGQWEWFRAKLDGDLEAAYRSVKRTTAQTPTPLALLSFGHGAIATNRPQEAWGVLSDLDPASVVMTRSGMWRNLGLHLTNALHMLEKFDMEAGEAQELRRLYPEWDWFLTVEIRARAAQGDTGEVERLVAEAISHDRNPEGALLWAAREFRVNGHSKESRMYFEMYLERLQSVPPDQQATPPHRSAVAWALYSLGRWDEALRLAEDLAQEDPSNQDHLYLLGALAARRGDRAEALRLAEHLEDMNRPYDFGANEYYRACIAALLGEADQAVSLLREAYSDGWERWIDLRLDQNLDSLRDHTSFQEFLRPKG
jgi:tetratricopeptide (TPR) repeat protein